MDNRWDVTEIMNASIVINTADYCHNTAQEVSCLVKSLMQAS
jgi:hypothetical protein